MLEIYFDKRGEIALENMEDLLHAFPQYGRRAVNSALSSEGFRIKNILQDAIKTGGPEGEDWPEVSPYTDLLKRARNKRKSGSGYIRNKWKRGGYKMHRQLKMGILRKPGSRRIPLVRLRGGIRYIVDKTLQMVNIGFVNTKHSIIHLARMHQTGFETTVTRKMRRMYWALAIPLAKETTVIKTPARPLIDPVLEAERETILENIRKKYLNNIIRYISGKQKNPD